MNEKSVRLLNHKVIFPLLFSVDVIRFERNVEIFRLIFYFFTRLVGLFLSILPETFRCWGGTAAGLIDLCYGLLSIRRHSADALSESAVYKGVVILRRSVEAILFSFFLF